MHLQFLGPQCFDDEVGVVAASLFKVVKPMASSSSALVGWLGAFVRLMTCFRWQMGSHYLEVQQLLRMVSERSRYAVILLQLSGMWMQHCWNRAASSAHS